MSISVVTLTRNNIATIDQCLSSLMPYYEQGYISEVVVVDDHSADGTVEAVKRYPVKLLFNEREGMVAVSRNIGWQNTSQELVMFLDSDAYLGEGFFPGIIDFFGDKALGIVGAYNQPVVKNKVMKTVGEWWNYHRDNLRKIGDAPSSWFQRLYCYASAYNERQPSISGPCYIVRRTCLQGIGGFDEHYHTSEELYLSHRITGMGWKAIWWLEAPLFHYPRATVKELVRQRYRWGKLDYVFLTGSARAYHHKIISLIVRLGTPIMGLRLALRHRNPLHLLLFPLAHYAWIAGYLAAFARARGGKE